MFPEYFVAIVNSKVEFVGAHGPRESLEESSCTTYIAAVVVLCLQVQGYCQVQDGLLLLLPASCIGHVHGMHNLCVPSMCTAYGDFCVSLYKLYVVFFIRDNDSIQVIVEGS